MTKKNITTIIAIAVIIVCNAVFAQQPKTIDEKKAETEATIRTLQQIMAEQRKKNIGRAKLAVEIRDQGWIVYSAKAKNGTWDLFISRPNGAYRKNITNTADYEEATARFSPDGKKLMYRRLPAGTKIQHDGYGLQGRLMIANANGANPKVFGSEGQYPWAYWSPDGSQISCLDKKSIVIYDLATKKLVKKMPRHGIYQQLCWSPDGKWFCGTANTGAEGTIVRVNIATGKLNKVSKFQNSTPDWFPDSASIIFSSRPAGQTGHGGYGYTQLWRAGGDGKNQKLIFGEDGSHIYGSCVSPDGKYVICTKAPEDGGGADEAGAGMFILRLTDAPIITGESTELRKLHTDTNSGPLIPLPVGWEPHWALAEINNGK